MADDTTTPTDDGKTRERWAYLGRKWTGKRLGHSWRDPSGEVWTFRKLHPKPTLIGGVYELDVTRDGKGGVSVTLHDRVDKLDEDERRQLVAADWRAEAERDAHRLEAKLAKGDPLLEGLEPLRVEYHRTNTAGKRTLVARVLHALSRRTPLV